MPFRSQAVPATVTTAPITELTSELSEMEALQKQELAKLAEIHRVATAKSDKIVEEQRLEIAQLKAQRAEDLETRNRDQAQAAATVTAQDEATSELRLEAHQTKLDIHALRQDMQEMLRSFKSVLRPQTPPSELKRGAVDNDEEDNSQQSEKRRDVRSTPGRKLFNDKMDLDDSPTSQQKLKAGGPQKKQK